MSRASCLRARIVSSGSAEKQIEVSADEAELLALDRALAVLSVDSDVGVPVPGSCRGLRDYRDDADDVRVIYFVTALRTVVTVAVAYIEA